jgi:hypothetical protein
MTPVMNRVAAKWRTGRVTERPGWDDRGEEAGVRRLG